ncbi:MAG: hypothetical protein P794_08560 [Epsilonproteobacteria bacterium (ex Lamellibrachia satsuma)]|nr:MAG: hypothetical protein P794_08560 [Epsilonproteobacteria bacterium (ex Lamellibrachia satsuma)]
MAKDKLFKHLYKDEEEKEQLSPYLTINTKRAFVVIFVLFLLLFPHYAPWEPGYENNHGLIQQLFTLYFFVANQTLGIVHESGHGICYLLHCPEFIMVVNGTIFQLLFPGLIAYYYKRKGNLFAALIALFFVGFSLHYTAWYISTAHEGLILPASKSFLGVDAYHDFNYMLSSMGLLSYDSMIAGITRFIAYLIMIVSVIGMIFDLFSDQQKKQSSIK